MDRCLNCQYYDRKREKAAEARELQWGQCRRGAPMLNPTTAKTYMIEGVWPTIRDDDWCGEWKAVARRIDPRLMDPITTAGTAVSAPVALPRFAALNGGGTPVGGPGGGASGLMASAPAGLE